MKKLTGIFAVVLTLALLLGAVVGVSASAEEAAAPASAEKWVISSNVAYADDIHPYFAINASLVSDASLLSVTVDGKATVISSKPVEIKSGVLAYVVEADGVAAKNMGKSLPIVVTYAGEVVEETSYSVAEYFYERLYKNGFINAYEATDALRKDLYIATLEYGAAAQVVLAPGTTPVTDLVYVVAPDFVGFWDGSVYNATEDYYKVVSYPSASKSVTSYIKAGQYMINNCAIITPFTVDKYQTSDAVIDFEKFEASEAFVYSQDAFAGECVTLYHYNGAAAANPVTMSTSIKEENGNKYWSMSKTSYTTTSNGQTWVNIKRTSTESTGSSIMFEAKIRFDLLKNEGNYFRFYKNGTDTKGNDGTVYGENSKDPETNRNVMFSAVKGDIYIGENTSNYMLGASEGEWFTLRLILSNTASGGVLIDVYASNDSGYLQHISTISRANWKGSVGELTNVVIMNDTTTLVSIDIDDAYIGPVIEDNAILPKFTEGNDGFDFVFEDDSQYSVAKYTDAEGKTGTVYDENGKTVPMWKGSVSQLKDIMTLEGYDSWLVKDPAKRGGSGSSASYENALNLDVGQGIFKFSGIEYPGEGNTFVFAADFRITGNDGQTHFDIRFRDSADKGVYRTYFGNGKLALNKATEGYASDLFVDGEWFNIRIEYTVVGATYEESEFYVVAYVNDVPVQVSYSKTAEASSGNPIYGAAADIASVGILLSSEFHNGTLEFKNIVMTWKNVDVPAAE